MKRRKFVSTAGLGTLGATLTVNNVLAHQSILTGMKNLTAEDVNKYLRSLIDVEEPSVDKIIIGDPGTGQQKYLELRDEKARSIASRLNIAGQPGVAFYGDENYRVRSVGVGTGCICNPMNYMQLEPDLYIAIDDTVRTWIQTTYAEDTGKPLVVVNHGTSEEFGIKLLNEHLKEAFQDYEVIHFKQGCTYKWISG